MGPSWVIEDYLARSARPGYRPGSEFAVARHEVDAWVERVRELGIASIICLLSRDQLPLYHPALPSGLLEHYAACGFQVAHVPTLDGLTHPYTREQLEDAWEAFQRLPKPVLVHCSAGYDRTGRVLDHILFRLNGEAPRR